jgi:inhibitor of cysteine peptidase
MATIEVTRAEDGASVDARVGDTIVVRLSDNPTTGYRWELEPVAGDRMLLEDAGYEPSSRAIGSGGAATWTLHAAAAGTSTIRVKRWRPWEGDSSVLERFAVTVHVHH